MPTILIRLLITLICCLPALAQASTSSSIHVEWGYTPPSAPAVTGFKLYQEGVFTTCQTPDPNAIAMDCQVTLSEPTTSFTLTATFSDGTESPQSSPFAFSTSSSTPPPTMPPVSASGSNLVTFTWEYQSAADVTGFRMYQNNVLICQTMDPAARQLACTVNIGTINTYALTAVATNGTETIFSNTLAYTADTTGTTTGSAELKAVITTDILSGPAPLSVNFNAASSTGTIASYQWDFGDGSSATGNTINHIFTTAGSYIAKLTVTDATGLTSTASTTVIAAASTTTPPAAVPPTAVISSSTAAGAAPLAVNFDSTGSTAATGASIASYSWSFGDGSSTAGASTSHTFTAAGTYTTTLTVIDNNGLTSSANTPVVVTAPVTITNKPPTALASATPMSGAAPLIVNFDGSASTDTDGTIASYVWNFGDGSTATGKTVTHTYTAAATYSANLQVTDNEGANNTSSPITINAADPFAALNIEIGEIAVSSNWVRVTLAANYTSPIVVAGPPGFNNADPCVVRLRNVDKTGFDIRIAEWNYEDGNHPAEMITYFVMEKGRMTLPDGSSVEAGTFQGTSSFKTVSFNKSFAKVPVIMTTIASVNGTNTISGRNKNVGLSSFAYYFREQDKNPGNHVSETVNFIAWEPGKGTIGSVQYEVATTAKSVTDAWYARAFTKSFNEPPMVLAEMQTTNDTDPSALRVQQVSATGFQVKVEEEKSKSTNITHTAETVGYLVLDKVQ